MLRRLLIYLTTVLFVMSASTLAKTWYVEKDGSGDFTTIQPAVDAAAPGDTIRIGPGRYTEYAPFTVPGWTENVYVGIRTDDLTLIGAGPDVTIIGPDSPIYTPGERPKVIAAVFISNLTAVDLTAENNYSGIYRSEGHMEVSNCVFRGCQYGITTWTEQGAIIDDCEFLDNISRDVITNDPANGVEVRNSRFNDLGGGISFNNSSNCRVIGCTFTCGVGGVSIQTYSDGVVTDCHFENLVNYGINVSTGSTAVLERNRVLGGSGVGLYVITNSYVTGSNNVFWGRTYATILISKADVDLHGNHIFHGDGPSVRLESFFDPPDVYIDLTDNYWGTTEGDSISSWILDGNDNPNIHAFVNYEPFSSTPIGSEQKTWGELKSLYR